MRRLIVSMVLLSISSILAGENGGYLPVPDNQLSNGRLLLPEIDGFAGNSETNCQWFVTASHEVGHREYYAAFAPGERVLLNLVFNRPINNSAQLNSASQEMIQMTKVELQRVGVKITEEKEASLECARHGKIYGYSMRAEASANTFYVLMHFLGTGRDCIVTVSYPQDGKPSTNYLKLLSSIEFRKTERPTMIMPLALVFLFVSLLVALFVRLRSKA